MKLSYIGHQGLGLVGGEWEICDIFWKCAARLGVKISANLHATKGLIRRSRMLSIIFFSYSLYNRFLPFGE